MRNYPLSRRKTMEGEKFVRLTVIKEIDRGNRKDRRFLCICECGNYHEAGKNNLLRGNVKSCGCLAKEWGQKGEAHKNHGLSHTRIDNIYRGMIARCYNSNNNRFHRYGGRGIKVCEEWRKNKKLFFDWAFSRGYDERLSIDRINNDGNYCPDNCRWATPTEQANNRCNSRK